MAKKVVLAGACRTAIGTMGGTLSTTPAPELGAIVIKEALKRAGVAPEAVDQVYMGCVIQAGQGQNVARQAAIKAGLPIEVPAVTMNVVCGSGLNCVNQAAQMIMAGDADIVVAGGMENMSMAPYAIPQGRYGYRMGNATMVDTMIKDALWDAFNDYHMIKTADNICEEWGLTREELDEFALKSQLKAEEAQKNGAFKAEIVPVEVKKKKETIVFDTDEGPRHGSTIEGLAKLRAIESRWIHRMTTIPMEIPTGIAKRHQLSASFRTKRITCFGVAPIQRIRPKNSVRWATLLFRLLAIIIIPANITSANNTAAAE